MNSKDLRELAEAYKQVHAPIEELYKGKHGQSDKEYADSRSQGGKMVSGDSKQSGAEYTHGRRVKAANPGMQPDVGGKTKPKSQGKMDRGTRADLEYRKANLKKEEYVDENRAAARAAGGYKDDSKKQPDPSKAGFTGVGNMSIDQIRKMSARIEREKTKKEELEATGLFTVEEIERILDIMSEEQVDEAAPLLAAVPALAKTAAAGLGRAALVGAKGVAKGAAKQVGAAAVQGAANKVSKKLNPDEEEE